MGESTEFATRDMLTEYSSRLHAKIQTVLSAQEAQIEKKMEEIEHKVMKRTDATNRHLEDTAVRDLATHAQQISFVHNQINSLVTQMVALRKDIDGLQSKQVVAAAASTKAVESAVAKALAERDDRLQSDAAANGTATEDFVTKETHLADLDDLKAELQDEIQRLDERTETLAEQQQVVVEQMEALPARRPSKVSNTTLDRSVSKASHHTTLDRSVSKASHHTTQQESYGDYGFQTRMSPSISVASTAGTGLPRSLQPVDDSAKEMIHGSGWASVGEYRQVQNLTIDRSGGTGLGIELDGTNGHVLHITRIREGVIKQWNRENPDKVIKANDRILEINGVGDTAPHLLQQIQSNQKLKITIERLAETDI